MRTVDTPKKPAEAPEIPKGLAARRAWILYQLKLRQLSYAELARRNQVTPPAVRSATRRPYPKMERVIAEAIDLEPHQLWPERYTAEGLPRSGRGERSVGHTSQRSRSNDNTATRRRNVDQRGAR